MGWLIWIGALLTLIGVGMLMYCIRAAANARKAGLDDDAMRTALQRLVAWNMAALGLSALGLMAVVIGLTLA